MSKSCMFCARDPEQTEPELWGMSPEGIQAMRERHDREHCDKCPTCGQLKEKK